MSVILYPKAHSTNFFRINNFIEIAKPPDRNSAQVQRAVKGRHTKKKDNPNLSVPRYREVTILTPGTIYLSFCNNNGAFVFRCGFIAQF
jgi:hypothetical protein